MVLAIPNRRACAKQEELLEAPRTAVRRVRTPGSAGAGRHRLYSLTRVWYGWLSQNYGHNIHEIYQTRINTNLNGSAEVMSRPVGILTVKIGTYYYKDDSSAPVQLSNALPFRSSPLKKARYDITWYPAKCFWPGWNRASSCTGRHVPELM
jgi:hypothetical protein